MNCPNCHNSEYYFGINGHDCPNPLCSLPGQKKKNILGAPTQNDFSYNADNFSLEPSFAEVEEFLDQKGISIYPDSTMHSNFYWIGYTARYARFDSFVYQDYPFIVGYDNGSLFCATHVYNKDFWNFGLAEMLDHNTASSQENAIIKFYKYWCRLDRIAKKGIIMK